MTTLMPPLAAAPDDPATSADPRRRLDVRVGELTATVRHLRTEIDWLRERVRKLEARR